MPVILRDYQAELVRRIDAAWAGGAQNVVGVMPTGAGKTATFAHIASRDGAPSVLFAHRSELVGQMSIALARLDQPHRIIAPKPTIKQIIARQVQDCGVSYYHPRAPMAVAGVHSLASRADELNAWAQRIGLWIMDEGHHGLETNLWGKAVSMFPNARGLLVTATPTRADGRGLGRHADGLADAMVEGPTPRELIAAGWLTDYRIFAPPGDYHRPDRVGSTGDFTDAAVRASVRSSHIVGDVVQHYLRIAPGKLGITFASDIETATEIAAQYNAAGVRAEVISAKTPIAVRAVILRRFAAREVLQLVNVDLVGEGFDLPAVEVVSFARPTESLSLYIQQFGRGLRPMVDGPMPDTVAGRLAAIASSRKPLAIVIDHVGNVVRHGLPDAPRVWSLDGRDKKARGTPDDLIQIRACLNPECAQVYERYHPACPYCGHVPTPASRSAPEWVDGDLVELDPAVLADMRGEVTRVDMPVDDYRAQLKAQRCPAPGIGANVKRHAARQQAQAVLRSAMASWAGQREREGLGRQAQYKLFYLMFGVDALSAQALDAAAAEDLTLRILAKTG